MLRQCQDKECKSNRPLQYRPHTYQNRPHINQIGLSRNEELGYWLAKFYNLTFNGVQIRIFQLKLNNDIKNIKDICVAISCTLSNFLG
jgi:hypothetical protein